jgi:ATP-dependent DNA helicase RecG
MGEEKTIKKGESERVEFKANLKLVDEIGETISALSNSNGGTIFIGVSNSGKIIGTEIGKNTLEEFANYVKRNTDPQVYPSIKVKEINGRKIILIEILESKVKPVFFKNHAFKRVGKTNQELDSSEIRKLSKETGEKVYWDEQISKEADLEDIDWEFVKEDFIPLYEKISEKKVIGKPIELLKSLGCIKDNKLTNAGILFFCKNPQKFFINSYIALARYKGKEISGEKLDYKEFNGNLFQQIDNCNNYLIEHTAVMSKLIPGEVRRRDIPEYGRLSIRELITNAVCHRDYSDQGSKIIVKVFDDRVEFYNPGGLPTWITPENITTEQYSRNPVISKVLAKVKYIEELGEGWDKIINEHKKHSLKPKLPEIRANKNSFLVTLFSTKEKFELERERVLLNERQRKIINFIKNTGRITTRKCADLLNVSSDTALRELSRLKSIGLIERKGVGKGIYYVIK